MTIVTTHLIKSNLRRSLFRRWTGALVLLVPLLALTACLETRDSVKEEEEKQVLAKQVKSLQTNNADTSSKFQEIDEDIRRLNGRLDINETRVTTLIKNNEKANAGTEARSKEISDRLAALQEALSKVDGQVATLTQQVAALEEAQKHAAASAAAEAAVAAAASSKNSDKGGKGDKKDGKGQLASADEQFNKKQWQEAALSYERYRKTNPKGKSLALATYRIGVCFQEMGSVDDAKAFFNEVLAKYPKATEASKASYRLKTLSDKSK